MQICPIYLLETPSHDTLDLQRFERKLIKIIIIIIIIKLKKILLRVFLQHH